jgi:hypothetical protein
MRNSKKIIGVIAALALSGTLSTYAEMNPAEYQQRIKDLGNQVQLLQGKGLLTNDEVSKFTVRLSQLSKVEESVRSGGFQKAPTDELEKSVTQLNGDVFKASHKANPIKPGQADKEVNDPNLIPAYPDANLKPGSGVVDKK